MTMSDMKVTSLRLDEGLAQALTVIARADGAPVSEAIRAAINRYVTDRRKDPQLRKRCRQLLQEDVALLQSFER